LKDHGGSESLFDISAGRCPQRAHGHVNYRLRTLAIVLLVSLITGCGRDAPGEAQSGAKKPASAGAGTQSGALRTVPYITLRNKTGGDNAKEFFGDDRSTVRAGFCDLSRTPLEILKPIAEKAPFYVPDDIVKLDGIRELPIDEFWREMAVSSQGQRPVLYTHGYYISFDRGCKRASLFQESLGLAGRFLLFSWPSNGAILDYTRDESDLYWSVAPLRKTLTDMAARFGAGSFDIAAHSLGTRGVFLALVQMSDAHRGNEPLVNQLVLLAPDIDAGIFKQYLPQIRPLVRNLTIYVSGNDKPLALSRQIHDYPRLGESGSHLQGLTGVEIIDLSDLPVRYPSGHLYHLYHEIVASDLSQLLNDGKSASQRSNLKQTGENYWRLQPRQ
jgi:esterase/lipase superfamily enzyme